MRTKLSEITTNYHTFEDNQVLTSDQLNEFISYFDDQDRLSRIFLSGVGIVCGFNVSYNETTNTIKITQGTGITTDGDLIKLHKSIDNSALKSIDVGSIEYKYQQKFIDSNANYEFFYRTKKVGDVEEKIPIEMIELIAENPKGDIPTIDKITNLKEKVVVLYLESYAKESDLCSATDCNNQGVSQIARLKVLLISKVDAAYVCGLDSIYSKYKKINAYFNLPHVAVERVILNQQNTKNYAQLKLAYYKAIIKSDVVKILQKGIEIIFSNFSAILNLRLPVVIQKRIFDDLKNITNFSAYNVPSDFQYRYDFIKDLVDTYNEIKNLLLQLVTECSPNIFAFPKHLMLGEIYSVSAEIKGLRHKFYKSPAVDSYSNSIERCRSLVVRLICLISGYNIEKGEIKITPSRISAHELSQRSIPFYYQVQSQIVDNWNFNKTKNSDQLTNLSYHTGNLLQTPEIQKPLQYNTDQFDFYRIEGHQGMDYTAVLEKIEELKTSYGLAFDVKALSISINSSVINIDDYLCEFEDLNVLLQAWTAEQECILGEVSKFFSGYKVLIDKDEAPGINVHEAEISKATKRKVLFGESRSEASAMSADFTFNVNEYSNTSLASIKKIEDTQKSGTIKKENVVGENLTKKEGTLGAYMAQALTETKGGSVNDIVAKAKYLVADGLNSTVWDENKDVKDFVIDQSIDLMAGIHVLTERMPGKVSEVNEAVLSTYKLTIETLCDQVKKMKSSYNELKLSTDQKNFMATLVNQLATICCSSKKLEILLKEIEDRKNRILLKLQLSEFVIKHPGLEHKAGVQPGGTFVLVYINKTDSTEKNEAVLGEREVIKNNNFRNVFIDSYNADIEFKRDIEKESIIDFESIIGKENETTGRIELMNRNKSLATNTVVADFSLPYMCCSDCSPVNFIIEKPKTTLRIESDKFCLGKDESPLLFEVIPVDGIIKSTPEVKGLTISGNKLILDEEIFDNEMIGIPILFTVNDQITNCQLVVYRAIKFDFKVPDSPVTDPTITFIVTEVDKLDGATFLWSFGDDNMSAERNPTHTYSLPVNEENKVTVSLTVTASNKICTNTVEHDIAFITEEVSLSLETESFCLNKDVSPLTFSVTPNDGKIEMEKDVNGVKIDGKQLYLDANEFPSEMLGNELNFTVNGTATSCKITVYKAPEFDFKVPDSPTSETTFKFEPIGINLEGASYLWDFGDGNMLSKSIVEYTYDLPVNDKNEVTVSLKVTLENGCSNTVSHNIVFKTDNIVTISLDKDKFCANETNKYYFKFNPIGASGKISGDGVDVDTKGYYFIPAKAQSGKIGFNLNGNPSGYSVNTVVPPIVDFAPFIEGGNLVIDNKSTGGISFVFLVDGVKYVKDDESSLILPIEPADKKTWKIKLVAITLLCGNIESKEQIFTIQEEKSCTDISKENILIDLDRLQKLLLPDAKYSKPIWMLISNLYGGTDQFTNGVLNQIDVYLMGGKNNDLKERFPSVLFKTTDQILEINRVEFLAEYLNLIQQLALLFQLFFNVLACQNAESIKALDSFFTELFSTLERKLMQMKEMGVEWPDSFKLYMIN